MIPVVKKSAVYVRVSSDEQVDNTSMETREAACRRWCAQGGHPQPDQSLNRTGGSFACACRPLEKSHEV